MTVAAVAAGSLLGLVPGAQADLRVSNNFRLNADPNTFRAKDQIGLGVDPGNPNHIVAVESNYLTQDCEASVSTNGGVTWSTAVPLLPPTGGTDPFQPTCRISNHLGETMMQSVKFGSGQNVYTTSIDPRLGATGEYGASTLVYKSSDGGQTWARGVESMVGGPPPVAPVTSTVGPYYELPTLNVDPGAASGADRVISVAHESPQVSTGAVGDPGGDVATAISNDGGTSFGAVTNAEAAGENVAGPDSASQPVINPDHSVSVAWRQAGVGCSPPPAGPLCGFGDIKVAKGTVSGTTLSWGNRVVVTDVTNASRPTSSHISPSTAGGSSFPRLAGSNGNLYIVYNQAGPPTGPGPTCAPPAPATSTCPAGYTGQDHFISPDSDVYFQRSLDGGATWSIPKLINDAGAKPGVPLTQTRHPDVSVAPNGRVDIVWQDRRHWYQGPTGPGNTQTEHDCIHTHIACDDGNARLGDTYYAFSTDGGSSFSANHRISDRSHNNDVGFDYRFGTGWAWGPTVVPLGNSQLLIGWMDAREGSFENDNQDIYLAKVDHNGSNTVAQEGLTRSTDAPQFSVDLSRRTYPGGGESTLTSTFATKNSTRPVIVNEAEIGQVLASGVLARANLGPVLLSPAGGLPASVKSEIARLNPAGAYVIGDTGSLSDQVVSDVRNAPSTPLTAAQVIRLDGGNEAGDAALIATTMDRRTAAEKAAPVPAFDAAVIVNPTSPDASAAAGLAAARRLPVLFTDPGGASIPTETTGALGQLAINKTLVIGSSSVVSTTAGLPNPTRLEGADRYGTSRAVINESRTRGLPTNIVYVADGATPLDGALLGSAVGRSTGLELLAPAAVATNAPSAIDDLNLSGQVDRMVLVQPATPTTPPPGGGGGLTTTGNTGGGADTTAPGVSSFGLTNNPFTVGGSTPTFGNAAAKKTKKHKKGTTLRYTLSEAGTVRITISQRLAGRRNGKRCVAPTRKLRKAKKCTRVLNRGTLTRVSHVGANSVAFSGRIGSKKLSPGSYLATLVATDAAKNSSTPKTISFTIVRR
ncbi:MAG: hypothetical protein M3065_00985 [Actinomycetota bacterium]|nr:hypothetical protein [Actinomycetota bacterium]